MDGEIWSHSLAKGSSQADTLLADPGVIVPRACTPGRRVLPPVHPSCAPGPFTPPRPAPTQLTLHPGRFPLATSQEQAEGRALPPHPAHSPARPPARPRSHPAPSLAPAPSRQEVHLRHQVQVLPPRAAAPHAAGGGRRASRPNAHLAGRGRRRGAAKGPGGAGRPPERPRRRLARPPGAWRAQPAPGAAAARRGGPGGRPLPARPQRRPGHLGGAPSRPRAPATLPRLGGARGSPVPASSARPPESPEPVGPAGSATGWGPPRGPAEGPATPGKAAHRPVAPPARGRPGAGALGLGGAELGRRRLLGPFGVRGRRRGRARPSAHGALQHLPAAAGGQRHGPVPRALRRHQAAAPHPEVPQGRGARGKPLRSQSQPLRGSPLCRWLTLTPGPALPWGLPPP